MATSLAEQLKRLAIPQTKILSDSRRRASLLFDPLEAAKISKESVFEIGLDGIKELAAIDTNFAEFEDTLYNKEAKYIQRAVESKDVNKKIDRLIGKFLIRLSPYLLLKAAHKALEWLIYRYQIHEVNVPQLFALMLPYHEANIFVRLLQLIDLKSAFLKSWTWLEPLQKEGLHLPKQVLVTHAISDSSFLRFICESTEKALKVHAKTNSEIKLRTQLAFYTSALVGVLGRGPTNDHLLTVLLPSLLAGLSSSVADFKAAAYMAVGQLIANNQLEADLSSKLLHIIMGDKRKSLRNLRLHLILMLYQRQQPPPSLPFELLKTWDWAVPVLAGLAQDGVLVGPLVLAITDACLGRLGDPNEEAEPQILCWAIADQVLCDDVSAVAMLRLLASHQERIKDSLNENKRKKMSNDTDKSAADWLQVLIGTFCSKYANIFDKIQDAEFQTFRRQCSGEEEDDMFDSQVAPLVRKCVAGQTNAWKHLKPLLLKQIHSSERSFKAWWKSSPPDEPLTLLVIIERLLRPGNGPLARKLIVKIAESPFGSRSLFIGHLKTMFDENSEIIIQEAIDTTVRATWNGSEENRCSLKQWVAAMLEMRLSGQFTAINCVWPVAIKMVLPLFTENTPNEETMDVMTVLGFISTMKIKQRIEILPVLIQVIQDWPNFPHKFVELNIVDFKVCLRMKTLELALMGLHDAKIQLQKNKFISFLKTIQSRIFTGPLELTKFACAVAAGLPFPSPTQRLIDPLFQVYVLHYAWSSLLDNAKLDDAMPELLTYLLMVLSGNSMALRRAAIKIIQKIDLGKSRSPYRFLFSEIAARADEIAADPEQLSVAMFCIVSGLEDHPSAKEMKTAFDGLLAVLNDPTTPMYIAARLAVIIEPITSVPILKALVPFARRALESQNELQIANVAVASYWQRLTPSTAEALKDPVVWTLVRQSLTHHKSDVLCFATSFLKVLNKEFFAVLDAKLQKEVLELLVATRAETESPAVSSAVAGVCRKISMEGSVVLHLLDKMVTKLPKELNIPPSTILESPSWRHGIALLELIQNKKKLRDSRVLFRSLCAILKFCLDQEEQTTFEYGKQLVLSCLLEICERHVAGTETVEVAILDVELIVRCLRASSNPQTHHHALLLLSCLGAIIPIQVMHNMMTIFTFMGSSVARLDDEHSVQVVAKVVDTVVPVLVESLNAETSTEVVVAEVLRIFVLTLRDVPQHRRIPLFGRLLTTLEPDRSLWIFLLLLFENYVVSTQRADKKSEGNMPPSLQLGMELTLSYGPEVVLNTTLKLIHYLTQIPMEKMNPVQDVDKDGVPSSDGLFDVQKHTPKQLRHYTYTLCTFLNTLLADQNLMLQVRELEKSEAHKLESVFKDAMAVLLLYIPQCTAQQHTQLAKFWKAMSVLGYDVLDRLVGLVSSDTLVGVITKLLEDPAEALRRKAVDLLNVHIQTHRGGFSEEEKFSLAKLVDPLLEVATATPSASSASGERELIQQTALLSLRLLAKVLAVEDPLAFKKVLEEVSKLCKCKGHLLASAALTVADLVAYLKVRSVSELPNFLPSLLKKLAKYVTAESTDIVLMSLSAALYRVVESLASFMSPYMDKLLHSICCLAIRWPDAADLNRKLLQIRQKLASSVPHRVLIPSLGRCYQQLVAEGRFQAIGPLLTVLADSLTSVPEVNRLLPELTPFFIQVLQIRSDAADGSVQVSDEDVGLVEGYGIDALMPLVLKLSELSFKPLYYQIFHWASEHPHRAITFYRLSSRLADGLKGLFVLFAGHFLQNAATLLDATNVTKTDKPYFGPGPANEAKAILLLDNIIQTLHTVFLFDSSTFLNKEKFQVLLHPLVDQLDNTLGGPEVLNERSKRLLIPCLAQMTLATDDTQWKALNYQLLTKTRSPSPLIRIAALNTVVEVAAKLCEDYLPLLPETIGSLAELLEDEDERVEEAMKDALRKMEDDLGQPIREYFQ